MGNVTIQKRGKYYQYKFEVNKVDGSGKESVSYDDFIKIEKDSLHECCSRNDCYVSFAKDLD